MLLRPVTQYEVVHEIGRLSAQSFPVLRVATLVRSFISGTDELDRRQGFVCGRILHQRISEHDHRRGR